MTILASFLSHGGGSLPSLGPAVGGGRPKVGDQLRAGQQASSAESWQPPPAHRPFSRTLHPSPGDTVGVGAGELALCFGTAAAGAGPVWNAGTGCAPGLLWKLAAGDGGGGGSQRAPSDWSSSGCGQNSQTPYPHPSAGRAQYLHVHLLRFTVSPSLVTSSRRVRGVGVTWKRGGEDREVSGPLARVEAAAAKRRSGRPGSWPAPLQHQSAPVSIQL